MMNALIQAQLDWWASFAMPSQGPRTDAEIEADRIHYWSLISRHVRDEDIPENSKR